MSFYNPNIQNAFDADSQVFIVLKDIELANIEMVFSVSDGSIVSDVNDIRAAYQLKFIKLASDVLENNLKKVNDNFVNLLSKICLEVLLARINSFEEYLIQQLALEPEVNRNDVLYEGDSIQDFIELLLYSDIISDKPSCGIRDFSKILGMVNIKHDAPVFYNLYDRLKLYDHLRRTMRLKIDQSTIHLIDNKLTLKLSLKI